jgi:hypothetical protein
MRLLAVAAVLAALPASAGLAIGGEQPIDSVPAAPFLAPHMAPAAGFDGTQFWVLWADWTSGTSQIYAQAVSPLDAGTAITAPLRLSPSAGMQDSQVIACNTMQCLAAWADYRAGSGNIYAARLGAAGLLDAQPIVVATDALDGYDLAATTDGDDFLLAWVSQQWQTDVAVRVAPNGQVKDTLPLLTSAGPYRRHLSAAFDGVNYVLIGSDTSPTEQLEFRISVAGTVLDPTGVTLHAGVNIDSNRQVASDGLVTVIHWHDATGRVFVSRVDSAANLLDPAGVRIGTGFTGVPEPAISAAGPGEFWVTWDGQNGRVATRFFTDGGAPDSPLGVPLSATADLGDIACAEALGVCLAVWQDANIYGSAQAIVARRLTAAGAVLDNPSLPLTPQVQAAPQELVPAAACNGQLCFAAWAQWAGPDQRASVYAERIGLGGLNVDAQPSLMSCEGCDWPGAVAAAASPTQFIAAWTVNSDHLAFAARMSADMTVLDSPELQLDSQEANNNEPLAAVFDGKQFVLAWVGDMTEIRAVTVSLTGSLSQAFTVASDGAAQRAPSMAALGSQVLLTWVDEPASGDRRILGTFLFGDGGVFPISPAIDAVLDDYDQHPALAAGDGVFAELWAARKVDDAGLPGDFDVYLTRILPDGTVMDPAGIPVATGPGDQLEPALAFDGVAFRAVWRDQQAGGFQAATVEANLAGIVPQLVAVLPDEELPVLASPGDGGTLMLYQRFGADAGAARVFQRWLMETAAPQGDAGMLQQDGGAPQRDGGPASGDGGAPGSDGGSPGVAMYRVGCGCAEAPDAAFWVICAFSFWAASRARRGSGTCARRP